jgi:putative regulator of septum formation
MKRVGIVVVGVALAVGGCGTPPAGTDGDLTNAWPALPAAQLVVPVAGACYAGVSGNDAYVPLITDAIGEYVVDCASHHTFETAYVGTFTGPDAATSAPPAEGSPVLRNAYATCATGAERYLGGYWQAAMVWLSLILPPVGEWRVGARWFRCDLGHQASPFSGYDIVYTGTVKDGLRGSRPLAITCMTTTQDAAGEFTHIDPVDCSAPHQAEFAGTYTAPDGPWPAADNGEHITDAGCERAVDHFLGFANSANAYNATVGYWSGSLDKQRWELGDRSVRCFAYAWTKNKTIVGSVRGIGGTPARSG